MTQVLPFYASHLTAMKEVNTSFIRALRLLRMLKVHSTHQGLVTCYLHTQGWAVGAREREREGRETTGHKPFERERERLLRMLKVESEHPRRWCTRRL